LQRTDKPERPFTAGQSRFLVGGFYVFILFFSYFGLHAQERYEYTHQQMGTQIRLVFYAKNKLGADTVASQVFDRIDELNKRLSDYLDNSELNALVDQAGKEVVVSDDLFQVLKKAVAISKATGGAFDISVGPFVELWRTSRQNGTLPSNANLIKAKRNVGHQYISFPKKNIVQLNVSPMKLDLGGIGKGFTADEVIKVLESNGIRSALVDIGGDIRVSNPPPSKEHWVLAFSYYNEKGDEVLNKIRLKNAAVATSGDFYQFVEIDGIRYSHIIDPITGMALNNSIQVTAIAKNATEADAFASAFSVMGILNVKDNNKVLTNLDVYMVSQSNAGYLQWNSKGFDQYIVKD